MPINVHEGETIINATLVVEENIFVNCKLQNCRLYYSGGSFEWANTNFENCAWAFRDEAANTLRLQMTIGMLKQGQVPPQTFQGNAGSGPVN